MSEPHPPHEINYMCYKCKRRNCKLWREYQTFLDHQELRCASCLGKTVNSQGQIFTRDGLTDQIGWFVPAVPTSNNKTFWGYTSVPEAFVKWWRSLPNWFLFSTLIGNYQPKMSFYLFMYEYDYKHETGFSRKLFLTNDLDDCVINGVNRLSIWSNRVKTQKPLDNF